MAPSRQNGHIGGKRKGGPLSSKALARLLVTFVGCRGGSGVMDERLFARAVGEPGESVLMPGSRLVRLDGCEVWETVHVTLLRRRRRAGEGGRVQDVSLRPLWLCGRPA